VKEALIDTDILSYFFKGDPRVVENFKIYLQKYDVVNLSIISYFEIYGGLQFKNASRQIMEFEEFANSQSIIYISEASAKIAGNIYADLRQRGIQIGTSDLLIPGMAIENDLVLVTNNLKHYAPIAGLTVENWKTA